MILKCFSCEFSVELTDNVFYCPTCLTQIRCKSCREPLLKGAIGCVACGTPINDTKKQQDKLNEIEFEQKGDSKKFKATFTDIVGHELFSTFGGLIGIQPQKKKTLILGQNRQNIDLQFQNNLEHLEDAEEVEGEDLLEMLNAVLRIDGDGLVFQTVNFKATKTINKEIRIALLTLLGYKYLHNAEDIKRNKITDSLGKFKLNSSNFRAWITKSEEIGQKSGGMIFLTPNGLKTSIEILKEVTNPDIIEGSVSFFKTKVKRRKSITDDGEEVKRSSGKSPKEYVTKLISEDFFKAKRTSTEILQHLKINHAAIFKTGQISTVLGRLIGEKVLKREKGESNQYVYFI